MFKRFAPLLAAIAMVLAPSAALAAPNGVPSRPAASPSIVDVALEVNGQTGEFDTLIGLLTQYPDIVQTLSTKGQYTVFAPTDDAFAELFAAVDPASLTEEQVKDVLLFHVANGRRDAAQVTSATQIRMLNGSFAEVDGATIDGANIIGTDVFAANGVIHVVDSVLLP